MPASFHLVEPHPSTSSSHPSFHTGRGGAGNTVHLRNTSQITSGPSAQGPASAANSLHQHTPKTFKTGRGGAGNVHPASERAIFSFDEELERQMRRDSVVAPVYHVGRGGAGNLIHEDYASSHGSRRPSRSETGSMGSADSYGSDGVTSRARRSLEKSWGKIVGH